MTKRGIKAKFIEVGKEPIQDVVRGHLLGISLNPSNKNYYVMIPKALLPKTETRSLRKWLGSDLQIAVAKFNALIDKLKGQGEATVETTFETTLNPNGYGPILDLETGKYRLSKMSQTVPEQQYIQWLKKQLQNPTKLAKKTGIPELAELGTILTKDTNIQLSELIQNYLNKKKTTTKKEGINSEKWFNIFCSVIDHTKVDEITLQDIHKYEDFIHSQGLKPKTIKHRINKISTIFKYNCGRFNSTHLMQVYIWLKGMDRPQEDEPYNPSLMSLENFNKLYEVSNLKWKAMLLLGLNCAMYPIDISRLLKSNIDFKNNTIAFRRGKKGKVLAVSTLWDRTIRALNDYLTTRKDESEYTILTKFGKNYSSLSITDYFGTRIRTKAGLGNDVKFSHLRDTFSTLAQDLGFRIEQVNLVLGHKNKGMQDRYAVRQANKLTGEMCHAVEKEFFQL